MSENKAQDTTVFDGDRGIAQTGNESLDFGADHSGAVNRSPHGKTSKQPSHLMMQMQNLEGRLEETRNLLEKSQRKRETQSEKLQEAELMISDLKDRMDAIEDEASVDNVRRISASEVNKRVVAPTILWLTMIGSILFIYSLLTSSFLLALILLPFIGFSVYYLWRSRDVR